MKKATLVNLMIVILIMVAATANAQTKTNFYIGKWDVLVKGLPEGDSHSKLNIADSAGQMKAILLDTTAAHKNVPINKIELEGEKITLYFTMQGIDLNLVLTRKDDDHATGSLAGMFDAVAVRLKDQ